MSGTAALVDLTVTEAANLIAARELSPVELTEAVLEHIDAVEPVLASYLAVCAEEARHRARWAEAEVAAGRLRGPLHGIPFGVKDTYLTAGVPTTAGSALLAGWVPDTSSTAVARLEAAGAVLVGKHNTWEFGTGTGQVAGDGPFPLARNPWNLAFSTGGSSTGSAPSVAARTAMFAMASDTGASIRVPAAAAGVVGLKPTYGRVSRAGIVPNTMTFDAPGPMARTPADAAAVLETVAGFDPADPSTSTRPVPRFSEAVTRGVDGLVIGLVVGFGPGPLDVDDQVRSALEDVARRLEAQGARIVECRVPHPMAEYRRIMRIVGGSESLALHLERFRDGHDRMGVALREKFQGAAGITAVELLTASRLRRRVAAETDELVSSFDAVLAPAPTIPVPRVDADPETLVSFVMGATTVWCNVSGHPAAAIPAGLDSDGLPIGVQVVGRYWDEETVLAVAAAHQLASGWTCGPPPVTGQPVDPLPTVRAAGDAGLTTDQAAYVARRAGIVDAPTGFLDRLAALAGGTMAAAERLPDDLPWSLEPAQSFSVDVPGR